MIMVQQLQKTLQDNHKTELGALTIGINKGIIHAKRSIMGQKTILDLVL